MWRVIGLALRWGRPSAPQPSDITVASLSMSSARVARQAFDIGVMLTDASNGQGCLTRQRDQAAVPGPRRLCPRPVRPRPTGGGPERGAAPRADRAARHRGEWRGHVGAPRGPARRRRASVIQRRAGPCGGPARPAGWRRCRRSARHARHRCYCGTGRRTPPRRRDCGTPSAAATGPPPGRQGPR